MDKKTITKILNTVTVKRYVNLWISNNPEEGAGEAQKKTNAEACAEEAADIAKTIVESKDDKTYYIDVCINDLSEEMDEAATQLLDIFNAHLSKFRFRYWFESAISIDDALLQLNEWLDQPALVIFHYFQDIAAEKEKDILIAIRKFIMQNESVFLRTLILTIQPVHEWNFSPYSPLNVPYIEIGKYDIRQRLIKWAAEKI